MTTKIIVEANHGWPVDVAAHDKPANPAEQVVITKLARVPAGETQSFYATSTRDLLVHEVQPGEIEDEQAAAAQAVAQEDAADEDAAVEEQEALNGTSG